jgi:hypothetical protein
MTNFKTTVKSAVDKLLAVVRGESSKEAAVRTLGIASELCRLGDAKKKAAKKTLEELGVISPGTYTPGETITVFDSSNYLMQATTKAPGSRLDAEKLNVALAQENISQAARRRIVSAATVDNAPATSFTVEAK